MATPRAISFDPVGKEMVGRTGQTSTQIVILTKPPQSYMVIPLGESDHPNSGHYDDQAEKLFSKSPREVNILRQSQRARKARDRQKRAHLLSHESTRMNANKTSPCLIRVHSCSFVAHRPNALVVDKVPLDTHAR